MKKHWQKRQRRSAAGRQASVIDGVIQHHGRFAFLLSESAGDGDVFLSGRGLSLAMDGDRVQARVRRERNGRFSGEILRVLERARASIVGVLRRQAGGWAVFPEKGDSPPADVLGFAPGISPEEGDVAVLTVKRWPSEAARAAGTITEILGNPRDTRVRITALLRARGIREDFPKDALAQSKACGSKLEPAQWRGREELFHLPIVTIDGADAKDFDDAVSLELLPGGARRLGVHIADVAHYVAAGSGLDEEAYSRATSVYLPDRVVPMLPPALSDNLCSLVPFKERLTMSVFMDLDTSCAVIRRRLAATVIRSCRRLTYEEAQTLLEGKKIPSVPHAAAEAVRNMGKLAAVLRTRRTKRGALDFDLPEYKIETDMHGRPLRAVLRPRLQSHRLIEEFMLLANEAVATELMAAKVPFLHRRHDAPDPVKMKTLAKTLGELGLSAGGLGGDPHKGLQAVLQRAAAHPLSDIINSLIVRSMKQAVYSPESSGHFGIAARAYAHFTSPIRRYPDLMAHRAVKALLSGKKAHSCARPLDAAGAHCSARERAASEAEHKAVDLLRAELFKDKIGSIMDGTVTSVIDSGAFVRLGDTGAEGLLRRGGLQPGAKVSVVVQAVDSAEGKIDLADARSSRPPSHWRVSSRRKGKR